MTWWIAVCLVSALFGWVGGYCYGFLMGERDTERRWADAVGRAHDRCRRWTRSG